MRSLTASNIFEKRVLLRVDFNVPIHQGKIIDDSRMVASLPTIKYLQKNNAKIILLTHLGRPQGKIVENLRLKPIAKHLAKLLKTPVQYERDCVGKQVQQKIRQLHAKEILLLENVRFYPQEEKNNISFAKKLAALAEVYVNDAFSESHREHASICAITKFLPSFPGFLLAKEVANLSKLKTPKRPYIAVLGGAKISDKLALIEQLLTKTDALLIGGAMAFTFLQARGTPIGKSLFEPASVPLAKKLLHAHKTKIILPIDFVLDNKKIVDAQHIPANRKCLDIGPESRAIYSAMLNKAKTIFWNGPMGLFEQKPFSKGTLTIARAIANNTGTTIIGGGETLASTHQFKLTHTYTHASTAGGAALAFIAGKQLPGLVALRQV